MNNVIFLKDYQDPAATLRQQAIAQAAQRYIDAGCEWVIQRFVRLGSSQTGDVYENVLEYRPMSKEVAWEVLGHMEEAYRDAEFRAHRIRPHEWIYWVTP